jgi:hypothetical protein
MLYNYTYAATGINIAMNAIFEEKNSNFVKRGLRPRHEKKSADTLFISPCFVTTKVHCEPAYLNC